MKSNLDEKITANLRFEIKNCGKTIKQIAAEMGVTHSTISQYCSGNTQPTLANLSRLCNIIGASADDILEIKKDS